MSTYRLPVRDESTSAPKGPALTSYRHLDLAAERGEGEMTDVEIADGDVVALELEGGFRLWMRGDDLGAELGKAPARGAGDGAWELLPGLPLEESAERGLGSWLLKGLAIFGISPGALVAVKAAAALEPDKDQILRRNADPARGWSPVDQIEAPADGGPVLLFIHGTFSSTEGSFGDLFRDTGVLGSLRRRYRDRIYGFEHRTLTEDPITNLQALVGYLPKGVKLHLVSHSRGGLVGDLLALATGQGGLARLSDADPGPFDAGQGAGGDWGRLAALGRALAGNDIRIERFVRVASPSRGTTLASGRLDRWLSVIANLAAQVPGVVGSLSSGFLDFLLAVVKERTNPQALPGLAAMMPGSPLIRLLNRAGTPLPGSLSVIAGDIQAQGIWARARLLIPDLFFAGEHDLVVNTGSMYGGPAYQERRFYFDQGPAVDHFSYFRRETSARRVLDALVEPEPAPGFRPISPEMAAEPARGQRGGGRNRPVLLVLPGIMGSTLASGGQRLWVDLAELARGGLGRLRLGADPQVRADGLIPVTYADLLVYFDQSHEVHALPYDWRLSIEDAARDLAAEVERRLPEAERGGQPLRILAHSTGGLVARAMIAARPDLWQRIRRHPGARLLMLGTPNSGSWEIVRLLVARAETLKHLALLDPTRSRAELLAIIGDFPGVLEILPDDAPDLFSPATWARLHAQDESRREDWAQPGAGSPGRLERARAVRARLGGQAPDPGGMVYLAGQAAATPCGVEVVEERPWPVGPGRKGLRFLASTRGDGRVLWDDGPLPGVPTWYAQGVEHGALANRRALFPVLGELLAGGRSSTLPDRPPVARGASSAFPMPEREPAYYPDERSLLTSALGMGRPQPPAEAQPRVRVSVVHGNLAFARHPVAVGHYAGDTIIAAEAYLDRVLGGRLRARQALGLYPGEPRTAQVFTNPDPQGKPKGALVLGLGRVGDLTPALLSGTFTHALLAFARAELERPCQSAPERGAPGSGPLGVALSSVLIGTGAGGIGIESSVRSLLHGLVRANALLAEAGQLNEVRISELELIELWEDQAARAAHALAGLEQDPELAGQLDCRPVAREGLGGHVGLRPYSDPEWWHRLQILTSERGSLRFSSLTQRARAEESLLPMQRELVDRFVDQAIGSTARTSSTARVLFEMLLPNRLKEGSELRTNLVLVVDESSARYPWELIEDRWSDTVRPPAVDHGLIRQLATGSFREQPTMAERGRALVIGDPRSDRTPLPGARREAEAVCDGLRALGYQVRPAIGSEVETILTALHADAYQVLHLAGHGVMDEPLGAARTCPACQQGLPPRKEDRVSGMVIGAGMVLTAADLNQMRQAPELVFINCCHLGQTTPEAAPVATLEGMNLLASSLAVQFIRMGVRAVVAAGWAVDDGAAETFAKAFYRAMGSGIAFGESTRLAREETWRNCPGVDTWGAYQCYGDPDYRMVRNQGVGAIVAGQSDYVAPAEAIADLMNLRVDALTLTRAEIAGLREGLSRIQERLDRAEQAAGEDWRSRGDLLEALGLAHGELGFFQEAVELLARAIRSEGKPGTGGAQDQRARFQARWAMALHRAGDTQQALRECQSALDDLQAPGPSGEGWLTRERCRSLTAIHSRRVQMLAPGKREEELERLIKVYDRYAAQWPGLGADPLTPYSRLLWLTAHYLLTAYRKTSLDEDCPDFDSRCTELEQRVLADQHVTRGIWNEAILRELHLLEALRRDTLVDRVPEIIAGLRRAMTRGVSERQFSAIVNNLDLLCTLCAGATVNRAAFRERARTLAELRQTLLEQAGAPSPEDRPRSTG